MSDVRRWLLPFVLLAACDSNAPPPDASSALDASSGPDATADRPDSGGPVDAAAACALPGRTSDPAVATTTEGPIRGVVAEGLAVFRGIPFAAPPTGDRRWRAPQAPACHADRELTANAYGAECPQWSEGNVVGDEDCLTLNIWAPVQDGSLPILVYLHGGGHEQGSGSRPPYVGARLAQRGAVVVTINYRLGPLGFLAHDALDASTLPSGNYGMHDQIAALRWVRANAAAFGGDPDRLMIFGQSAGGVSVCRLLVSPLSAGLFSSAMILSASCPATRSADAHARGDEFAATLGCTTGDIAGCLRERTTLEVIRAFTPAGDGTSSLARGWDGVVDGYALPDVPRAMIERGEQHAVPVVIGSAGQESGLDAPMITTEDQYRAAATAFLGTIGIGPNGVDRALEAYPSSEWGSPRAAYIALSTDAKFTCGVRHIARSLAASNRAPAYRFFFEDTPDRASAQLRAAGAFHGLYPFYAFGTLADAAFGATPGEEALIEHIHGLTLAIASGAEHDWPRYEGTTDPYYRFAEPPLIGAGVRNAQCDFWESL